MSNREKLPATKQMTRAALINLHGKNGTTLVAVKKYISETYNVNITTARKNMIRNYLHTLIESKELLIKTGRGLTGHFLLRDLKKFTSGDQPAKTKRFVVKITRPLRKKAPREHGQTSSIFDTPAFSGTLAGSTPIDVVPKAPARKAKRINRQTVNHDETPRSSTQEI
uniref:H15 domain-containing protein n=1 Tax=Glossina palpalis gambiensis TaxID=67801 RepID=A0A1B0BRF9_9MUSC